MMGCTYAGVHVCRVGGELTFLSTVCAICVAPVLCSSLFMGRIRKATYALPKQKKYALKLTKFNNVALSAASCAHHPPEETDDEAS